MRKKYKSIQKFYKINRHVVPFTNKLRGFKKSKWFKVKNNAVKLQALINPSNKRRLYPSHLWYKNRLGAKQVVKSTFGSLKEKQLKTIVTNCKGTEIGLLHRLGTRIDILIYQLGFSNSIYQAQQYISYGYFTINSKKVYDKNITLKLNDVLSVDKKHKKLFLRALLDKFQNHRVPYYIPLCIEMDIQNLRYILAELPTYENSFYHSSVDLTSTSLYYTKG